MLPRSPAWLLGRIRRARRIRAGTTAWGGTAHLILDSAPGSYIGQGKDWDITDTNATAYSVYPSYNLPDGQWTNLDISVSQSSTVYASTTFSTHMLGIPIQPGTYENAERFPFEDPGHPGLDVTFYDEGSNTLTGFFVITDATFYKDSSGNYQLATFAATYDQTSDNDTSHVTGSITYLATGFGFVPEPSSAVLLGIASVIGLGVARLRQRRAAR